MADFPGGFSRAALRVPTGVDRVEEVGLEASGSVCSGVASWASSSLIHPAVSLPRKGCWVGLHIDLFEACSALPGGVCTHWKVPPCHGAHPKRSLASTTFSPAEPSLIFGRFHMDCDCSG